MYECNIIDCEIQTDTSAFLMATPLKSRFHHIEEEKEKDVMCIIRIQCAVSVGFHIICILAWQEVNVFVFFLLNFQLRHGPSFMLETSMTCKTA